MAAARRFGQESQLCGLGPAVSALSIVPAHFQNFYNRGAWWSPASAESWPREDVSAKIASPIGEQAATLNLQNRVFNATQKRYKRPALVTWLPRVTGREVLP